VQRIAVIPVFLAPACLVLCPASARADDVELPAVEVDTEKPPLLDSVSPVEVLEVDDATASGKTAADFVDDAPGVQVIRSGSALQRQTVTIRGSDSKQVQVLVEGFNMADPQSAAVDLSLIPLAAVDSFEVYRGGRGAMAGSGAMGGVVVVRLKDSGPAKTVARSTAGFFSPANFDSVAGSVSVTGPAGFIAWSHEQSQGDFEFVDRNDATRTRSNNEAYKDAVAFSLARRTSAHSRLSFIGSMSLCQREVPGFEQFPSDAASEQSNSFLLGSRLSASRFPVARGSSDISLSWGLWQWTLMDPKPYFPPPADTHSANSRLTAAADTHLPLWGKLATDLSLSASRETVGVTRAFSPDVDSSRMLADVVLAASWGRSADPANAALRTRLAFIDQPAPVPVPSLEAGLRLADPLRAFTSLGRSFRAPSFDEMYFESVGIRGNPDLDPEDLWSAELGLTLDTEPLSATGSAFYQIAQDTILFLPVTAYTIEAQNTGETSGLGAELSSTLDLHPFSITASLAYLDLVSEDTHQPLPLRSPWSGNAQTRFESGPWTAWLSADWRSGFAFDRFNSLKEEGRVFVDAGLALRPGAGFLVAASARNLLDTRDAVDAFQYPLPGRAWFLTVQKEWDVSSGKVPKN
jgi:outer membrane receptor protein involved in Fe transport